MFFDDVEVPVANLIGERQGWDYATFLLGNEAHRHRPRRRLEGAAAPHQGTGVEGQFRAAS